MRVTERHIYGSSRLGMDVQSVELIDQEVALIDSSSFRILGLKQYEISNHLGNVLSVISDVKLAVTFTDQNNLVSIVGYKALVISATDYSPFGVGLYERSWSAPEYRYGFNGMESIDESSFVQSEYRALDLRICRWLSIDNKAKDYPNNSVYSFALNIPIWFSDFNGNDPIADLYKRAISSKSSTLISLMTSNGINELNFKYNVFQQTNSKKEWFMTPKEKIFMAI
jgi:RHS repeat-associated protein